MPPVLMLIEVVNEVRAVDNGYICWWRGSVSHFSIRVMASHLGPVDRRGALIAASRAQCTVSILMIAQESVYALSS